MDNRSAFQNIVELVFNSWTALQLAVEHGMGGSQSRQVALQFVEYIVECFSKKQLEIDEVEDLLIDILDSQFHTECEDGSPYEVASELCRFFKMCKDGDAVQLFQEVEKLQGSNCKLWLVSKSAPEVQGTDVSSESRSETPPPQLMETDSDGWTVVNTRKK